MTDVLPTPAARLEELTSLYERQAYLAWNVALRTALVHERAAGAARRAFLAQVTSPDERRVAHDAARLAAEGTAPVDPRNVEEHVLAATARLAPAQRAALALSALAGASGEQVASALGIEPATESALRERAYGQLGTLLGVSAADAQEEYGDLPWADPPEELWAALYPELHGAVTRHTRAAAQPQSAAPQRPRGWAGPLRRVPRVALVAAALLAVAGVAWAATGGGGSDGGDAVEPGGYTGIAGEPEGGSSLSGETGSGGTKPATTGLTPEELDRLRQEEIEDLKRFTRRKADKRLPPRERRRAARKVGDLVKLALARQRAAERRELAIRHALAREREARIRERNRRQEAASQDSEPTRERQQPAGQDEPARQEPAARDEPDRGEDGERSRDKAEAECLYDAGSGTYICPE